ncbi:MAG: DUF6444 domain-containing protein [Sedimentisphaerales bacterium]
MTSTREQFYKRRIAELEAQLRQRNERIATLEKQVAKLLKGNEGLVKRNAELSEQVAKLTDQVAKLSKNSSNSSKPPSSDIVKPPKPKQSDDPRQQGGQPGHKGVNRQPFAPDRIDKTLELHAGCCDCGYKGPGQPIDKPKIQQTVELSDNPVSITEYHL